MLSLLKSIWNLFTGGVADIWHHVISLISAVWSYADRIYNVLAHDVTTVYDSLIHFAKSVDKWVTHTVDWLRGLIQQVYHDIVSWAVRQLNNLRNFAVSAYRWTVRELDKLASSISATAHAITSWVIQHIWQPLDNAITGAIHWIEHEGAFAYDLVTHPDKLAALLAAYLFRFWLALLRQWAVPITRFVLHQSRALVPDFVSILEDVITKVL